MAAILLDGKKYQQEKLDELKKRINQIKKKKKITPFLQIILIGNNSASNIYVNHKIKFCKKLNINYSLLKLSNKISEEKLKKEIIKLNKNDSIDGILVQFPLPNHLSKKKVASWIEPQKDVDGIHPNNLGNNFARQKTFAPKPCTPKGIIALLKKYQITFVKKHVVILGRSLIVGRPLSFLLMNENATVTIIEKNIELNQLKKIVKLADILVLATGVADIISPKMVKKNVIIVDVGIIRKENNLIRGDILYKKFLNIASYITPVPGGIGPMTISMLMENIISIVENKHKINIS